MSTVADQNQPHLHTEDLWGYLAHIIGGGTGRAGDRRPGAAQWVPDHDTRRLAAYRVLSAFLDNRRRFYLPQRMWARGGTVEGDTYTPSEAEKWAEYGDPDLLVDTARSLVLGEDQSWELDHADDPNGATILEWLEQWSTDERVWAKVHAGERNTIGLGDCIYALGWSVQKTRPRLRVFDPGFYFPDHAAAARAPYSDPESPWEDDDYPPVVHLAWDEDHAGVMVMHRETWWLAPEDWTTAWGERAQWRCWRAADEWRIDALSADDTVLNLPVPGLQPRRRAGGLSGQTILTPATPLPVDFIPVVHVPNDTSYVEHGWGRPLIARIVQVFDDLAAADSDLADNARLVGSPTLVTVGAGNPALPVGPGAQVGLPIGSGAEYLDTSKTLDALLKHRSELIDRLRLNARLSGSVVGDVSPDQVPSGVALRLGFAPTEALVREMRRVRDDKLPLIPKMAARLAIAAGALNVGGDVPPVRAAFGGALPADRAATIAEVKDLLAAKAVSVRTAVGMLRDVGIPIDDVEDEIRRIVEDHVQERAQAAVDAVTALQDEGLPVARRLLGVDETAPGSAPVPPVPAVVPPVDPGTDPGQPADPQP